MYLVLNSNLRLSILGLQIWSATLFIVTLPQTLSLVPEYAQLPYPFIHLAPQSNNHDAIHTCCEQSHLFSPTGVWWLSQISIGMAPCTTTMSFNCLHLVLPLTRLTSVLVVISKHDNVVSSIGQSTL